MTYLIPFFTLMKIAAKHNYQVVEHQENIGLVILSDGAIKVNVYCSTMTVATCLNHPRKGKTQLFRKNVTVAQLEELLEYPRKHTGKGYYKNKK